MEKTEEVRAEIDATREKMAATAAEIESRIHGKVDAVKQKLDVADHVRAHPWPALAIALVAGAALAASDADRKAIKATTRAAKKAPRATGRALKAAGTGAAHLAGSAVKRVRGGDGEHKSGDEDDGFFGRMRARFAAQARELGEHLGRAADDIVRSSGASGASGSARRGGATSDASMPTNRYSADEQMGYTRAPGDSGIGITTPYPPTSAD